MKTFNVTKRVSKQARQMCEGYNFKETMSAAIEEHQYEMVTA